MVGDNNHYLYKSFLCNSKFKINTSKEQVEALYSETTFYIIDMYEV